MSEELAKPFVEAAESYCQPFPGDNPSGTDISFDSQFEAIKAEIDKMTALSGSQPDWREVVALADQLTREKAKDFRVLVWSTLGRYHANGVEGLASGIAVLQAVAAKFWDTMNPPARRAKARANLLDWMHQQLEKELSGFQPNASNGDTVKALSTLYDQLDSFSSEKLGDAYGGLGGMRSRMRDLVRAIPQAAPPPPPKSAEPAPVAAPSATAAPAASAGSSSMSVESVAISGVDDVLPALRTLGKNIQEAARQLRRADPANAWSYRLQRTGLWLAVKAVPPAENSKTRIPPPGADVKKKLEAKMAAEQWMDLLTSAEDATSQFIFWLDLHRLVAVALDRLGALFIEARSVVGKQMVTLLETCPTLPKLCFSDGTPFADPGTQSFLEEEQSKFAASGGGGGGSSRGSEEDEELKKRFEEAKEMVGSGKIGEGLALATQLAARAADERSRYRGRLALAELALKGGKAELARPIFERLLDEATQRQLEDWEPALAASVCSGLVAAHRALGTNLDAPEQKPVFDRLCRLDPASALRWSGS